MKVNELKDDLQKLGLARIGKKQELLDRLLVAVANNVPLLCDDRNQSSNQVNESLDAVKWVILTQEEQCVTIPSNPIICTDPSGNTNSTRHNLQESFNVPPFNLTSKACRRIGRSQKFTMDGNKPKKFEVTRTAGRAKLEWLEQNDLNEHSHPVKWLNAMLKTLERSINGSCKSMFDKWTTHTNLKAILANAGQANSIYSHFNHFLQTR